MPVEFIPIETEQTTAATDVLLGLVALVCAWHLKRNQANPGFRLFVWLSAFYLLTLSAMLGAIAHGLVISPGLMSALWHLIYLSLGLCIALFVVGCIHDIWSEADARRALPIMLAVAFGFYLMTIFWPDNFFIFILYEAAALMFALGGYVLVFYRTRRGWALLMLAGIAVTIAAAVIQANHDILITLVWQLDHNGVFHLVQVAGVLLLAGGLGNSAGRT